MSRTTPCDRCPWRIVNQGKRTPWGFYSKRNLRRLWNQIRGGGAPQSCHPTDPSHPDHIEAGAKPDSEAQECPGAVILVLRELELMASYGRDGHTIDDQAVPAYLKAHRDGLTKQGIAYWALARISLGGVPFLGGPKLPPVNTEEPGIGRP